MKDKTEDEIEMMKIMGFGSFDTTKVLLFFSSRWYFHKGAQVFPRWLWAFFYIFSFFNIVFFNTINF